MLGHLMQGANFVEKALMLGDTESKGRRKWKWMSRLDGNTYSMDRN